MTFLNISFRCLDFTKVELLLLGLFYKQRKIIKILDTRPMLNVHVTFTSYSEHLMNGLYTFNLGHVSSEIEND